MDTLHSPFGEYHLSRWPVRSKEELRAWNAADELLLNHLHEVHARDDAAAKDTGQKTRVLVVNDEFGALSCVLTGCAQQGHALRDFDVTQWSDSFVSQQALQANLDANQINAGPVCCTSLEPLTGQFDIVLIKVPKTTAFLEDQLYRLRPHLTENTLIVAGAMVKHLQRTAFEAFETIIGPVTTSLAVKKARLVFVQHKPAMAVGPNPYPTSYNDRQVGFPLINHANLFSRDHLDLGARFLITQLGDIKAFDTVTDLACGNGVLGILYAQRHTGASVHFIDESYMAVASAAENYQRMLAGATSKATFTVGDGLSDAPDDSTGLVLCNPPFHQQHVVDDFVGTRMIQHAKRCLQQRGELWLVANRQLNYQVRLKRLFGNCRKVAANGKFVVFKAIKR